MNLSTQEMETIINIDRATNTANVYSDDPIWIRKLAKLESSNPETFKKVRENDYSVAYEFPKNLITIRRPRVLSEEQKADLNERLARARDK